MDGTHQNPSGQPSEVEQPRDVFLSYSRGDKPRARDILQLLEKEQISVWWDEMLEGGVRFHQVTEHNLEIATSVVVLWSEISVKSHWVHDEATRGRDRGVLISVSIDGTPPPLGFRQFQWLDLSREGPLALNPEASKLVHAVKAKQSGKSAEGAAPFPAASNIGAGTRQIVKGPAISRRTILIGGSAALAGAVGLAMWQSGLLNSFGGSRRLAVLPFKLSGNETPILAGIADEVRTRLTRNPLLHVTARTSSEAVGVTGKTAGDICRELQVDYLLTGEVSSDGQRIAVKGELVDGQNDLTLLPISQAGPVASVLTLQNQIASDVVRELTNTDDGEEQTQSGGTNKVAAYNAFLEGTELYAAGTSEETDRAALAKFDEAIRIDPSYAAAHAARGRTLAVIANLYGEPDQIAQMYEEAVGSAREATRIAPLYPTGFSVIGDIHANRQLDFARAREPFEIAAKLGGGDATLLSRYAVFKARIGDFSRARKVIASAIGLDPLNAGVLRFAGNIEYDSRAFDAALRFYKDAQTIQKQTSYAPYLIGITQLGLNNNEAAKASFEQETRLVWRETGLAIAKYRLGDVAAAEQHYKVLKESQGEKSNYQYMQVLAQWGQTDAALDAMDNAWIARDSGLVQFRNDPLLDPIRHLPRAKAMLSKIGFA
ncbi:MAG: TIR domain-containing protein [Erythrobacter sp.]|jgi:TolB-like protein/Tfp pilus assembly protein PilF|nr:TIR domain-containing protein [Erythrobacter sp.]